MFLSPLITELSDSGHLIVDLADDDGPKLRFGSFESGMLWERWEGNRWTVTETDYGVMFANRAHELRKNLPVQYYLAGVPSPVVEALYGIPYLQATIFKFCAYWEIARKLLTSNPILLWMVAENYNNSPAFRDELPILFELPQRVILEVLLNAPVRPVQVRFLTHIRLSWGDRSTLTLIRNLCKNQDHVLRLKHWDNIPSLFLSLLWEAPYLADSSWLREEVAGQMWGNRDLVTLDFKLLQDTVRLMKSRTEWQRYLLQCRSWVEVQAVHDTILTSMRAQTGYGGIAPDTVFPRPPVRADRHFVPITTMKGLIDEGQAMHHCVATRAPEIISGSSYIYKVSVAGERGTLEVTIRPDRKPAYIEAFKLACNKEPSPATWKAARQWLSNAQ